MWLIVIISLFALPHQIESGVLVSNQEASFGFLTVNTLFDD